MLSFGPNTYFELLDYAFRTPAARFLIHWSDCNRNFRLHLRRHRAASLRRAFASRPRRASSASGVPVLPDRQKEARSRMREPETLLCGMGQLPMASKLLRPVAALTIGVAVASCGLGFEPDQVRDQGLDTATFTGALAEQYVRLAEAEAAEGDWRDADVFIDRGRRIAAGETIGPEPVDGRELPPDSVPQVTEGRARLLSALDRGGRIFAAAEAAQAQVYFDCWNAGVGRAGTVLGYRRLPQQVRHGASPNGGAVDRRLYLSCCPIWTVVWERSRSPATPPPSR